MVHCCCVPGCSNNSKRDAHLSFFSLPLKRKKILKQWIHKIGRKNLPITKHVSICSDHFVQANGRLLRKDEVPSLLLPASITSQRSIKSRNPPKERPVNNEVPGAENSHDDSDFDDQQLSCDVSTQTDETIDANLLVQKVAELERELKCKDDQITKQRFRLANIKDDDSKVLFYTGFDSYQSLQIFYEFLGPSVHELCYSSKASQLPTNRGRPRTLPPIEELFVTLIRLRLGLMEKDLAFRFEISQSTVSRIIITWINFLYMQMKEIPLWPPREVVKSNMPIQFKEKYGTTRVIIDATEIYIDQPKLPELQKYI